MDITRVSVIVISSGLQVRQYYRLSLEVILNIWMMLAVVFLIGANLFWMWLLNKYPFSQIYPLTSLGFVFGMLSGVFIFHESVGYMQWIGVLMVILGCYFIAKV